jgi:hypothetical protein
MIESWTRMTNKLRKSDHKRFQLLHFFDDLRVACSGHHTIFITQDGLPSTSRETQFRRKPSHEQIIQKGERSFRSTVSSPGDPVLTGNLTTFTATKSLFHERVAISVSLPLLTNLGPPSGG